MKKINLLLFLDDNNATNYYHNIIVNSADVATDCLFFESPTKTLAYFEGLAHEKAELIPDVLFLDINLPEIDGWEFLEQYAKIPLSKTPRIIMLTTSVNPVDRQKTEANPLVSGILTKPLTEDFLKELRNVLLEDKS